jgi:transposase
MAQRKHEPGPPMDLANMRRQGVRNLIAYCLNDACRHQAVIDVSSYPGETLVPWFRSKVKCAKCGARHNRIDVRPNWKEAPGTIDDWSGREAIRVVSESRPPKQKAPVAIRGPLGKPAHP